ncbi:MAG: 2-hydroxyacyl-CoA dehydratase [Spirochaetes bacterium]|nr:2-hydroxyacyl-CoA dehydratase [Spirochaetota bacterium]
MKILHDSISGLKKDGRPVIGCFPLYPPLELFHSMGIVPLVLWGLGDAVRTTTRSDRHLQSYTCSVGRRLAEFVLSENGELLDGMFMYNACDTLRNFPEILESGVTLPGRRAVPMLKMHVPAGSDSGNMPGESFLAIEIAELIRETESLLGVSFSGERFKESVALYREMRSLAMRLQSTVARGLLSFRDYRDSAIIACMMPVEEQIALFSSLLGNSDCSGGGNTRTRECGIVLSGILPPPAGIVEIIENAELCVAANDCAMMHRSWAFTPSCDDDPVEYYAELYRNHFPCTTLLPSADRRIGTIIDMARESGARGIMFIGEKFCEYEYFEMPLLEERLEREGIHTLRIELTIDDLDAASVKTRIEAFAELLRDEGRRAPVV